MNLMDKEFLPWQSGYYMVSNDGYIYVTQSSQGGPAGRFLIPNWQNGIATVNVRIGGRAKQLAVSTATLETWGIRIKTTEASTLEMRQEIREYHDEHFPAVTIERKKAISQALLDKADEMKNMMPCPWESHKLDTLPFGVTSWSDPIMDPMSGGFPMRTFSVPSAARSVAA